MPLFGKPLYEGSSNWLYYTNTSSNIKIPIKNKNKDCSDDEDVRKYMIMIQ